MRELPDDIRVPLHELQADVRYFFGRVTVETSTASIVADAVEKKLAALEAALQERFSVAHVAASNSLASDLTNHLADYGEWCVGAGGQDTVDRIARFITDWTSGEYHWQQVELAREQAEFHAGIRWLADRAEPRLRGRHFRRIDP